MYYVQQGDYLEKIERDFSVTVEELVEWNNLESMLLELGQGLALGENINAEIDSLQGVMPDVEDGLQAEEYDEACECVYHRVRFGETVFDIAYEYGVRVEDILRKNTITNILLIEQGLLLKIPK
jgi:LysM repeat protein